VNKVFERHSQGYSSHPDGIPDLHNKTQSSKKKKQECCTGTSLNADEKIQSSVTFQSVACLSMGGLSVLESSLLLIHFRLSFCHQKVACNMGGGENMSEKWDKKKGLIKEKKS